MPEKQTQNQPESAQQHYNESRMKSFAYSRVLVFFSMLILLGGLLLNMTLLNPAKRTSTSSQAAAQNIPTPPTGCLYEIRNTKMVLICDQNNQEKTIPTTNKDTSSYPLAIDLPPLSSGCSYQTTNTGYTVMCTTPQASASAIMVKLPNGCSPSLQKPDSLSCSKTNNKTVTVPLPPLPQGCVYTQAQNGLLVRCAATQ